MDRILDSKLNEAFFAELDDADDGSSTVDHNKWNINNCFDEPDIYNEMGS